MSDAPSYLPPYARASRGAHVPEKPAPARADDDLEDDADADDLDREDDERPPPARRPAAPVREGLPATYRMRHEPHYVETLVGPQPRPATAPPSVRQRRARRPGRRGRSCRRAAPADGRAIVRVSRRAGRRRRHPRRAGGLAGSDRRVAPRRAAARAAAARAGGHRPGPGRSDPRALGRRRRHRAAAPIRCRRSTRSTWRRCAARSPRRSRRSSGWPAGPRLLDPGRRRPGVRRRAAAADRRRRAAGRGAPRWSRTAATPAAITVTLAPQVEGATPHLRDRAGRRAGAGRGLRAVLRCRLERPPGRGHRGGAVGRGRADRRGPRRRASSSPRSTAAAAASR